MSIRPTAAGALSPVSLGQGYSTLAWIPETEGSWSLPLRHECITSWENPISLAAFQLSLSYGTPLIVELR
jgi:hypothetical protein